MHSCIYTKTKCHPVSCSPIENAFSIYPHLCGPDLCNSGGDSNVVGLKLVKTDSNEDGCALEDPHEGLLDAGGTVAGEVVGDT